MGSKCKCKNPESGGTTCPDQHIAVCTRWLDGECHGECIPIPKSHSGATMEFQNWAQEAIKKVVEGMVRSDKKNIPFSPIEDVKILSVNFNDDSKDGGLIFNVPGNKEVRVRISFEFSDDRHQQGGTNESFDTLSM